MIETHTCIIMETGGRIMRASTDILAAFVIAFAITLRMLAGGGI